MIPERVAGGPALHDAGCPPDPLRQKRADSRNEIGQLSLGDIAYRVLALLGWVSTTLLTAAGCFVVLFLMAGNGSPSGFFEQVSLLGQHYLTALPAARSTFDAELASAAASVVVLTGFFRRAALIFIFKTGGGDGQ
jgi:hypothetical protein